MSAFFEINDCDVLSVYYTSHPSNHLSWSFSANVGFGLSQIITILSRSSDVTYENVDLEVVTGSLHLSGVVRIKSSNPSGPSPLSSSLSALYRLRDFYFKNQFERSHIFSTSSFWKDVSNPQSFTGSCIDIPQVLYGENIKKKSVKLIVSRVIYGNTFSSEYIDDGFGCLVTSSTDIEDYNSVISNIAGVVFYNHGFILFSETGYLDGVTPIKMNVDCYFSGTNKIPTNMYLCSVEKGLGNFSLNPSYVSFVSSSNENEITTTNPKTFITGIGLYDENYDLVGVAKLATPILNEEKNSITFKLKLNF